MVRLTVFLGDQLDIEKVLLKDETNLCGDAEVRRCDQDDFFEHGIFGELVRVLNICVQLLLFHHIEVHDISNVQVEDPVLRVLHTECVPDIEFESLVFLDIDELFEGGE